LHSRSEYIDAKQYRSVSYIERAAHIDKKVDIRAMPVRYIG